MFYVRIDSKQMIISCLKWIYNKKKKISIIDYHDLLSLIQILSKIKQKGKKIINGFHKELIAEAKLYYNFSFSWNT